MELQPLGSQFKERESFINYLLPMWVYDPVPSLVVQPEESVHLRKATNPPGAQSSERIPGGWRHGFNLQALFVYFISQDFIEQLACA